jgi:phosphoglycerate dehydrogenase-like enzyme
MKAAFAMRQGLQHRLFTPGSLATLSSRFDIDGTTVIESFDEMTAEQLAHLDILITGWGSPTVGPRELDRMPRLRAIIHAAGTVKYHLDAAVWERGIVVSTAATANAYPVAEYALGMILLAGKNVFGISRDYLTRDGHIDHLEENPSIGGYGTVVGIVGASRVGRRVIELLRPFDFTVLVYDPYLSKDDATALGAQKCELDELMTASTIVSIHSPDIPQTRHQINAARLARLPDGATIINTARPAVIDQNALLDQLRVGRLSAVLDVTDPEPLPANHELRVLPNVVLTPHLAGAQGNELFRLGASARDEALRVLSGEPLLYPVTAADLTIMA